MRTAVILSLLVVACVLSTLQPVNAELVVHDPNFQIELYATLPTSVEGLAYTSGGSFADGLYAMLVDGTIYHLTAPNTYSPFVTGLPWERCEPAFDPSGDFGGDLYVAAIKRGSGGGDEIIRIDPSGNTSVFFDGFPEGLEGYASGMAFGPAGSGFGSDLYIPDNIRNELHHFDASANRSALGVVPLGSDADFIDLEFSRGGDWGTYAFVSSAADYQILRVDDAGVSEVFYSWDPLETGNIRTIAFGDGGSFGNDLYGGDNSGQIVRIDSSGQGSLFVSGLTGKVKGSEFGDNQLFVSTIAGDIYRISAIPEPSTLALIGFGLAITFGRRRCKLS